MPTMIRYLDHWATASLTWWRKRSGYGHEFVAGVSCVRAILPLKDLKYVVALSPPRAAARPHYRSSEEPRFKPMRPNTNYLGYEFTTMVTRQQWFPDSV
ncbi:hypothetical protein TNCV_3235351 [Trichonephila clavipes]|nr:hypothetical protein TNCV_3235351 [Trichonephila clavipes]